MSVSMNTGKRQWCESDEDDIGCDEEDWGSPAVSHDYHGNLRTKSSTKSPTAKKQRIVYEKSGDDMLQSRLRHSRTILHIDVDCFYAQVEMIRNPSLRDKPLGIQQKYIVVTCNYVARQHGVTKLMGIKEAFEKCPQLVLVKGEDLTHYRQFSYRLTDFLQQYTPLVERLGFDENFLDITELIQTKIQSMNSDKRPKFMGHCYGYQQDEDVSALCTCGCYERLMVGSQIAFDIRQAIYQDIGLTCCAGVSHNKLMAKLVAGTHKPNDQTVLLPDKTDQLLLSLNKVRQIPGIGHTTGKKLVAMGIHTVQELKSCSIEMLQSEFGYNSAVTMYQLVHGVDDSPVKMTAPPQSISDEDSFRKCSTLTEAKQHMTGLLHNVITRMMDDGRTPHTLRVTVRKYSQTHKWSRESRQCPIPADINAFFQQDTTDNAVLLNKLLELCVTLFTRMVDISHPFHLTLINICFAKLKDKCKPSSTIQSFFTATTVLPNSQSTSQLNKTRSHDNSVPLVQDQCLKDQKKSIDKNFNTLLLQKSQGNKFSTLLLSQTPQRDNRDIDQLCDFTDGDDSIPSSRSQASKSFFEKKKFNVKSQNNLSTIFDLPTKSTGIDATRPQDFIGHGMATQSISSVAIDLPQGLEGYGIETETESTNSEIADLSQERGGHNMATKSAHNDITDLPQGIDSTVFAELPSEVQQELLDRWREEKKNTSNGSFSGLAQSSQLSKKSKQNGQKVKKTIVNYFSKK
ncbi:DNA polymerase iota-like [Glandiceps talaboti]